jgi:hypothetical protein
MQIFPCWSRPRNNSNHDHEHDPDRPVAAQKLPASAAATATCMKGDWKNAVSVSRPTDPHPAWASLLADSRRLTAYRQCRASVAWRTRTPTRQDKAIDHSARRELLPSSLYPRRTTLSSTNVRPQTPPKSQTEPAQPPRSAFSILFHAPQAVHIKRNQEAAQVPSGPTAKQRQTVRPSDVNQHHGSSSSSSCSCSSGPIIPQWWNLWNLWNIACSHASLSRSAEQSGSCSDIRA